MVVVVRLRWELRTRIWFWVTVSIIALLHLALIWFIPWPNTNYRWPVVFPVGVVDYFVISYLIRSVARWMGQPEVKQSGQDTEGAAPGAGAPNE